MDPEEVRNFLEGTGFNNGTVQYFGTNRDLLIRMPPQPGANQSSLGDEIFAALRASIQTVYCASPIM